MNRFFTSLFIVALVASLTGCDKLPFANKKVSQQSAVSYVAPIKGEVLAQVDNWRIGTEDFQMRLDMLKKNPQYAEADLNSVENKKAILQELIRLVALSQEAQSRGFSDDPEVKQALADFERTLLVQKLVEKLDKEMIITDVDVQDYYQKNSQMFTQPGTLRVRELAVNSEADANNVLKRFLDGESFVKVAQEVSILDSRAQGGDLGELIPVPSQDGGYTAVRVEEGKEPVEVKRFSTYWINALGMTPDADARKVKGDDGKFYVIKVTESNPPKVVDLSDQLKEQIKQVLKIERQSEELDRIANTVKQNSNLVINEGLL